MEGGWPFQNYGPTYNGSLLWYGSYEGTPLVPDSDYIVYALPLIDGKDIAAYTADDFFYEEISVPGITAGGSVTPQITELATSMSSVSAQIVADGAYKVYAQWIPKAEYEAFADEAAIGMVNQKTTAVRIIPVIGKKVGDTVEFGGLLGYAPVMPVNSFGCARFVDRGGRIPAPIHSFKN